MDKSQFIANLSAIKFNSPIQVVIGSMEQRVERCPLWSFGDMRVGTRTRNSRESIVSQIAIEIENDLKALQEKYPGVVKYGMYIHTLDQSWIQYAKVTSLE